MVTRSPDQRVQAKEGGEASRFSEANNTMSIYDLRPAGEFETEYAALSDGAGIVDLNAAIVDYSVQARVLQKPELMSGISQAEIDDFTKTVVPIKISGNINSPSVRPDIEGVFRQQVEDALEQETDKLKDRLFDRLLGGDEEQAEPSTEEEGEEAEEEDLEEQLKEKLLKDLIGR